MKVSIITPVYNSSQYLAKCIESVFAQTYSDWEMLCVDDASTDNSLKILESYAANELRIRVFAIDQNHGQAYARNIALTHISGDIVAFYYNNKILLKRVIGTSGDIIDISEDGTVFVNGQALDEPYVNEKAFGECDIELPYQVPDNRIFVMGDHRSVSVDSRSTAVGCIADENVIGKVIFRIWPWESIGTV